MADQEQGNQPEEKQEKPQQTQGQIDTQAQPQAQDNDRGEPGMRAGTDEQEGIADRTGEEGAYEIGSQEDVKIDDTEDISVKLPGTGGDDADTGDDENAGDADAE